MGGNLVGGHFPNKADAGLFKNRRIQVSNSLTECVQLLRDRWLLTGMWVGGEGAGGARGQGMRREIKTSLHLQFLKQRSRKTMACWLWDTSQHFRQLFVTFRSFPLGLFWQIPLSRH